MNDKFIKNIISLRGEAGKNWLEAIPSTIALYEKKWNLKVSPPYKLSYNYVAPALRYDETSAVLKIGFPGDKDILTEIRALRAFNGEGSVKLYEADEENYTLLLEKIEPGETLTSLVDDTERVLLLAEVIKKLDKPIASKSFPTIADWGKGFDRLRAKYNSSTGPFPKDLFEKAEAIFKSYIHNPQRDYLLHGDLHEENVLLSERGWLAIDPKGILGVPEFETAMFLNDPFSDMPHETNHKKIVIKRIELLAERLHYDKNTIRDWAFAQAMLSTLWVLEDHDEVSTIGIRNTELLNEITF